MNLTSSSRTSKSLRNSAVALSFAFLTLFLQFFSRKIFLNYLGEDILGLNTTVVNLLQFLNLAELGIGAATTFSLYRPLKNGDRTQLCDIISMQGALYKRIAFGIICGALVLMVFFPLIFKKISLPLWYAYASFLVMLYSSLLGYFVNYRQVLLAAHQEDYKISLSYKSVGLVKVALQMLFIYKIPQYGYIWWLILEVAGSSAASFSLSRMVRRTFPWLAHSRKSYKELKKEYNDTLTKVKQLFFHNIGTFVLSQTSPLIIYAYISLAMVAKYGNYMLVVNGVTLVIQSLFNSVGAGVGNLVAEGNYDKIKRVFVELFSVRFYIVTVVCFLVFSLTPVFIELWIGKQYVLPDSTLAIMTCILFIALFRSVVGAFIAAYGLFSDVYSPLVESLVNLSLSVLLGHYYGLNGILGGVLISQVLITMLWKPYFLFTRRMSGMGFSYVLRFFSHAVQTAFVWWLVCKILELNDFSSSEGMCSFLIHSVVLAVVFGGFLFISLCATRSGMNMFVSRFLKFKR